jgi:hypothetical protein
MDWKILALAGKDLACERAVPPLVKQWADAVSCKTPVYKGSVCRVPVEEL